MCFAPEVNIVVVTLDDKGGIVDFRFSSPHDMVSRISLTQRRNYLVYSDSSGPDRSKPVPGNMEHVKQDDCIFMKNISKTSSQAARKLSVTMGAFRGGRGKVTNWDWKGRAIETIRKETHARLHANKTHMMSCSACLLSLGGQISPWRTQMINY